MPQIPRTRRPRTPQVVAREYLERIAEYKHLQPNSAALTIVSNPAKYKSSLNWNYWMKLAPKLNQKICITAATLYVNHYSIASMVRESSRLFGVKLSYQTISRAIRLVLLGPRPRKKRVYKPRRKSHETTME